MTMLVAAFAPVAVPAAQQGRSMSKAATAAFIPVARPSIATFTRKGAVAMRARSRCSSVATTANVRNFSQQTLSLCRRTPVDKSPAPMTE